MTLPTLFPILILIITTQPAKHSRACRKLLALTACRAWWSTLLHGSAGWRRELGGVGRRPLP